MVIYYDRITISAQEKVSESDTHNHSRLLLIMDDTGKGVYLFHKGVHLVAFILFFLFVFTLFLKEKQFFTKQSGVHLPIQLD